MRTRTTWQGKGSETARQAATHRRADIYDMNYGGPRPQPTPDQYMAPDAGPAMWAESPASYEHIEEEYDSKGHVLRNEIGMAEFRKNTFDRPAWGDEKKYDNRTASERKAVAAHRLASSLLKTTDRGLVRKVALGFMSMPDAAVSTALRAMDQVSPKALPDDARFKRAFACTKLAAGMLGDGASEESVERLARSIYEIDDPTLRSIVKSVAMAKIAQEQQEEEEEEEEVAAGHDMKKHAQEEEEGAAEHPEKKAGGFLNKSQEEGWAAEKHAQEEETAAPKHDMKKHAQEEEEVAAGHDMKKHAQEEEECWGSDSMKHQPHHAEEEEGMPKGTFAEEEEEEEDGEEVPVDVKIMLEQMKMPAQSGLPAMTEAAPAAAPAPAMSSMAASLEALFSDDPEVQAHREIQAASNPGFQVGRVASTKGVKKLGKVQASEQKNATASLEALWDRP